MGLREEYGHKIEEALNKLVDEKLAAVSADLIKVEAHKAVDALVDKYVAEGLEKVKNLVKSELIDLIDGVDNIPKA